MKKHLRVRLGKWFVYEHHIRLRIFNRQWWFGVQPPWEQS